MDTALANSSAVITSQDWICWLSIMEGLTGPHLSLKICFSLGAWGEPLVKFL